MTKRIADTDLILNNDGSVYHLNLRSEHISDTIITVGDQNRVQQVSRFFDRVDFRIQQREFVTHGGTYNGRPITVISTGIGTDNVEIVLLELDVLANVDTKTREPHEKHRKLSIIRIGTSGSMQADIPVGSHLASNYAVGFDNLNQFYTFQPSEYESIIGHDIQEKLNLNFTPYVVQGSAELMSKIAKEMMMGNTLTAPGFYAPQGRSLRITARYPGLLHDLSHYAFAGSFRLSNFEMETAGYYLLGKLLGHDVISTNAIVANRVLDQFSSNPGDVVESLIEKVLRSI